MKIEVSRERGEGRGTREEENANETARSTLHFPFFFDVAPSFFKTMDVLASVRSSASEGVSLADQRALLDAGAADLADSAGREPLLAALDAEPALPRSNFYLYLLCVFNCCLFLSCSFLACGNRKRSHRRVALRAWVASKCDIYIERTETVMKTSMACEEPMADRLSHLLLNLNHQPTTPKKSTQRRRLARLHRRRRPSTRRPLRGIRLLDRPRARPRGRSQTRGRPEEDGRVLLFAKCAALLAASLNDGAAEDAEELFWRHG